MNRREDSTAYLRTLTARKAEKPDLDSGRQQDADEFLRVLLDVLENELVGFENFNRIKRRYKGREVERKKFIESPTGKCKDCNNFPSANEQDFLALKLIVPNCSSQVDINILLNQYFIEYGSEVRMKCSTCCKCYPKCKQEGSCNRPAVSQRSLMHAPNFLFIQLCRFGSTNQRLKVITFVRTLFELKLQDSTDYQLLGTLDHRGKTMTSGHYVTKVLSEEGQWLLCNDLTVTPIPFEKRCLTETILKTIEGSMW